MDGCESVNSRDWVIIYHLCVVKTVSKEYGEPYTKNEHNISLCNYVFKSLFSLHREPNVKLFLQVTFFILALMLLVCSNHEQNHRLLLELLHQAR